ncbi:helix-turn-helix domain-containing protein [Paraglaciecola arctica]|uniref:helix-turn-helix domain-containing protein n=1 Tax=Paraglaciecola arctica TaxID=1128911 RepID=UPI001C07E065|nr:helix-turn-helix domain-containing protein [Paraglaciecola arctica]MBU3004284.1 helix-turn-helix domain-containing protein [Paraglaciecola arctica]
MKKPELLNRNEAADYISVKPQTLSVWATTGRYGLPFIKVGRKVFYRREELDQFLDTRTSTQTQ